MATGRRYRLPGVKMNERCPVCGQPMEIVKGFYYSTGYVSYALSVAVSVSESPVAGSDANDLYLSGHGGRQSTAPLPARDFRFVHGKWRRQRRPPPK